MKMMKRGLAVFCVLSLSAVFAAETGLVGFWSFDGMAGENAEMFVNSAGGTAFMGTGYANDTVKPVYSDDAPGVNVYSDAAGTTRLCTCPHSLAFNYPEGATSAAGGGYAIIDGLAAELSKKSAYTIEYFIKFDKDFDYYAGGEYCFYSKTSLWVGNGTTGYKVVAPNTSNGGQHALGVSVQAFSRSSSFVTPIGVVSDSVDYSDGKWHHLAVVFDNGTLSFFADKKQVGSAFALANTDGTGLADTDFVLGTGRSGKRAIEPFHGQISCLRVSDGALTTNEFMVVDDTPVVAKDSVVGFWDFSDGMPGTEIDTITNRLDSTRFIGTAAATTAHTPVYSADSPGRYVYSDGARSALLATDPLSADFGPGTYGNGGKISLDSLATALTRLDGYTLEFFFKVNVPTFNNWRTLVGWKYGDNAALKMNLTGDADRGYRNCTLESIVNTSGTALAGVGSSTVTLSLGTAWHHFAAVYSRADNAMWTYIDKVKSAVPVAVTNQMSFTQHPLVLGNSAFSFKEAQEVFGGNIACVRVTARGLEPEDFMVVADERVPSGTVFALNFEDGAAGDVLPANGTTGDAADSYPNGVRTRIPYNLHAGCSPRYVPSLKSGRQIRWGETERMWTNNLCLRFPAGSDLPSDAPNRIYYGAMLEFPGQEHPQYNPSSWTMEAFVKLERADLAASHVKRGLIFGKAGNAAPLNGNPVWFPRYCWTLSYTPNGYLRLDWTERPTADYDAYAQESSYFKNVQSSEPCLGDCAWHHLALSYDANFKMFRLFVDHQLALTQSLLGEVETTTLYDGAYSYFFGRFPTTGGFEGYMDEIRFSSKVLSPAEFEQFPNVGTFLMFR